MFMGEEEAEDCAIERDIMRQGYNSYARYNISSNNIMWNSKQWPSLL